jgi:chromosome segregation ATPase
MKTLRLVAIGLGILAIVLVIALVSNSRKAVEQKKADDATITLHSNNWVKANEKVDELGQVNLQLESQLNTTRVEVTNLATTLARTETNLLDVQAALKQAQDEVARREARIAELESQNQTLERQAMDLTNALAGLNVQIEDTKNKLAAAEGDKTALEKELKRLLSEKLELERKFNDLATLKAQVKKIKTELVTAKRLEWLRTGIQTTEPKGAEKMTGTGAAAKKKKYDLNVEVRSDGSLKVIPPIVEKPAGKTDEKPVEMK